MALIPGTLPSGTLFPGTPQALLNLLAAYLSPAPSRKTLFFQNSASGIPTDGSALWWDTGSNILKAYSSGAWNIATLADGAVTPAKLSSGKISWDTTGKVWVTGTNYSLGFTPAVSFSVNGTDAALMPVGSIAQRPAVGVSGYLRYNSEINRFEGYNAAGWGSLGGATGGGTDAVFYENDQTVTTNYTISTGRNAMTAGPVSVTSGVGVTIPAGSTWTVV